LKNDAEFVWADIQIINGRGVGHRAKTPFTLTQLFLRLFALVMSRDTPAREGRFATLV